MAYTGQPVEIPLTTYGLTGSEDLAGLLPGQLTRAENISYFNGALTRDGGLQKYNGNGSDANNGALPAGTVVGGYDWWPTTALQRMIVYEETAGSGGIILRDAGTGAFGSPAQTPIKTGLATNVVPVFVSGGRETATANRKLFIFTGNSQVQVISGDGTTTSNLATPPADWASGGQPITGCIHEARLWAASGHRVYYSNPADHEDFTAASAGTIGVYSGTGDQIKQIMSFKEHFLLVFKEPVGIYFIDTSSPDVANWSVGTISSEIGIASPQSAILTESDVFFVDYNLNFQFLSGIQEFGKIGTRNLSDLHRIGLFVEKNVLTSRRNKLRVLYHAEKREVQVGLTAAGTTVNSMRLVVDMSDPSRPRFRTNTGSPCEGLWLRRDGAGLTQRPVGGSNGQAVYLMDWTDFDDGASGTYLSLIETSTLDFGAPTLRKNGDFLTIVGNRTNGPINVDVYWDGLFAERISFNFGTMGAAIGSFVLDTDALAAGERVLTLRKRLGGAGYRLNLQIWKDEAGEDFSLSRVYASIRIADEKAQQGTVA